MKAFPLLLGSAVVFFGGCTSTPAPTPRSASVAATPSASAPATPSAPPLRAHSTREFWVDLVRGDEIEDAEVFDDLATAGAVYIGETHTIARHHEIQLRVLQQLFARRLPLVLCMEQLEAADQPAVDRYNRREIDFATLADDIKWASKWRNYVDYQPLCEFARQHGVPIRALNAPADLIRTVSRGGGVAKLTAEQRAQLPADLNLDAPEYERLTNLELAVHVAADPAKLRPMFEAQLARDETMAANIVEGRRSTDGTARTAIVVLGAGHMRFGFGTAAAVRRREPGIIDRLVLMSESGGLQLTPAEKGASRDVTITHADLRALGRPPADYVRVLPVLPMTLPPGHPPLPRQNSAPVASRVLPTHN